jgi:hypothetical protein
MLLWRRPADEERPFDVIGTVIFSRATRRKMRQNLWWAAGYNVIAFPLAAGLLYPSTRVATQSRARSPLDVAGSTLIVVANALLLKRVRMSGVAGDTIAQGCRIRKCYRTMLSELIISELTVTAP